MILAQFPLQIVVFPKEVIHLHIFEDRYKQLVKECESELKSFGIVAHVNGRIADHGTEVILDRIHKTYDDGQLDIVCSGQRVYRISKFHPVPPKDGYSTAEVDFVHSVEESSLTTRMKTKELLDQLTEKLSTPLTFEVDVESLHSSQVVHKLGMSQEKELDLLQMLSEEDRLQHICKFLEGFIPQLDKADEIRRRIKMNGHFKRLDPLDF